MRTSESVLAGHPDKVADQIADAVLDAVLAQDPFGRVACEVMLAGQLIVVGGEITTAAEIDAEQIARDVLADVGHDYEPEVRVQISQQSPSISRLADAGAGDSGIVYGYATRETESFMPLPIMTAHAIAGQLTADGWGPDGKVQVTMHHSDLYQGIISIQHDNRCPLEQLEREDFTISGFTRGGPLGDTGLTGRKPQVDSYGGAALHGGGAFSGKDPTKVDRTGAYAARWLAKTLVAEGYADEVTVAIAYEIGLPAPVMVTINGHRGALGFDLRVDAIIEQFGLRRPIYRATSVGGHFGRDEFPWEHYKGEPTPSSMSTPLLEWTTP